MARPDSDLLVCQSARCGYDADKPVLEHVDLVARRGEILAILGGSGSGKSTLLKTIGGLLPPLSGSVRLLGQDPYALDGAERQAVMRRTGTLFQHGALFASLSVIENVMLPVLELTKIPRTLACEMARSKLALVELSELEHRLPSEISGGQRKRVALARAAVLDPAVLFCDEPTSGLDPATASRIDDTLIRFRDVLQAAIVAVTHDVEGVRAIADRAIVVDQGQICAEGEIDELTSSDHPTVRGLFHRGGAPKDRADAPNQETHAP